MRVLLVAGTFPPAHCGVGDYAEKLATALAKQPGIAIGVLTTRQTNTSRADGVIIINKALAWRLKELFSLIQSIRAWRPDVVHFQYPSQGFFERVLPHVLPIVCRLLRIKVVQTWHEPYRLRRFPLFFLNVLGANGLIFVRPNYLDLLPPSFRTMVKRFRFSVIPNASSLPLCKLSTSEVANLRLGYLEGKTRLIVFFGFLYPSKGVEQLFEIANPLTDRLVLAGPVVDPAYQAQLKEQAALLGWEEGVQFAGFLPSEVAANLLAAADAVLLPFLTGGGEWNTSIHAAQSQGTLIITTSKHPAGDDLLANMYTAAPGSIDEMRNALNRLSGRRSVSRSPDAQWGEIAAAHLAFYQSIQ
ncbi:MAG: glycosyltransferase [Hydrogenophaga sp.]|uniref:glycosyltransferase n=1 Tax=Hydrogenophaga sp. TaxID=1904254 RepID=UPI003D149D42